MAKTVSSDNRKEDSDAYRFCCIYPDMADFEVVLLIHRLHNAGGRRIVTIAETLDPVYSQSGLRYLPDKTIDQVSAEDFAVEVCRALQIYRDTQQEYDELGKI